jgi:hypothetical protein
VVGVEAFGLLNPNDFSDELPQFRAANEDFHYPSIWPTKPPGAALEPGPRANYASYPQYENTAYGRLKVTF